jgi:hypothetical protein
LLILIKMAIKKFLFFLSVDFLIRCWQDIDGCIFIRIFFFYWSVKFLGILNERFNENSWIWRFNEFWIESEKKNSRQKFVDQKIENFDQFSISNSIFRNSSNLQILDKRKFKNWTKVKNPVKF